MTNHAQARAGPDPANRSPTIRKNSYTTSADLTPAGYLCPIESSLSQKPTGATKEEGRSSSAPLQDEISPIACVAVHAQHDSSDGSVVKAFAAIRMPSAMVR